MYIGNWSDVIDINIRILCTLRSDNWYKRILCTLRSDNWYK